MGSSRREAVLHLAKLVATRIGHIVLMSSTHADFLLGTLIDLHATSLVIMIHALQLSCTDGASLTNCGRAGS